MADLNPTSHRTEEFTHFLAGGVLAVFGAAFFFRVLFFGELLGGGDLNYQYYIWKEYFVRSVREGVFPFWNPYPFCGTPFFHEIQTATLYPLDWIYFYLPLPWGFGFSFFLHILLAGWAMYLLAGDFLSARFSRLLAGLTFMGSGFVLSRLFVGEPTVTQAYAWSPLFFLSGKRLFESPGFRKIGLFAVVSGLFILTGHPQIPFLMIHLLGGYLLFGTLGRFRETGIRDQLLRWGAVFIGGSLGLALVAVQAAPFLELAAYSASRAGGAGYRFASEGSLPPDHLITLFLPFFYGDPTRATYWGSLIPFMEICGYMGAVTLLMAVFSGFSWKERQVRFWWWAGIIGLVIALGHFTPIHRMMYAVLPGWNLFRNPNRALLFFTFAVSLLAGYGLDALLRKRDSKTRNRILVGISLVTGSLLVLLLAVSAFTVLNKNNLLVRYATEANRDLLIKNPEADASYVPANFIHRYRERVRSLQWGTLWTGAFLLWGIFWFSKPERPGTAAWILLLLVAADLFLFGRRFPVSKSYEEWKREYFPDSALMKEVAGFVEGGRLLVPDSGLDYRYREAHPELFPNGPMRYRIRTVRGYCSTILKHYSEFINIAQYKPPDRLPGGFLFLDRLEEIDPLALQVMGVRAVTDYRPVSSRFRPEKKFSGGLGLYSYRYGLPRCFRAEEADNRWGLKPIPRRRDRTRVVSANPNEIVIETEGARNATLVFSDCFFPGWEATVDGRPVPIEPAFHAFQGVRVPSRKSRVVFRFRPTHWSLYVTLSAFSGLVVLALLLVPPGGKIAQRKSQKS